MAKAKAPARKPVAKRQVATGQAVEPDPMRLYLVPIDDLVTRKWDKNPRVIAPEDFDALKASLARFGILDPILVNLTTGRVLGGHQRIDALIANKAPHGIVRYVRLSEQDEEAANIALNRIKGSWEWDGLAAILRGLDEDHRALTGFRGEEVAALLASGFHQKDEAGTAIEGSEHPSLHLAFSADEIAAIDAAAEKLGEGAPPHGTERRRQLAIIEMAKRVA